MAEFRDPRPRGPIANRETPELLEDLCLSLREVGVRENHPRGQRDAVFDVRSVLAELEKREVSVAERIERLSAESGWLMDRLLDDCRTSDNPEVCESDGIRRRFRCHYCKAAERPESDVWLCACSECLNRIRGSFETLQVVEGTVLMRTYNAESRCEHANEDTVVVAVNYYEDGIMGPGRCRTCLDDEAKRRGG